MISDEKIAALNYLLNYNFDINRTNMTVGEIINSVKFSKEQWNRFITSGETDMGTSDATEKVIKGVLHDEELSNLRVLDTSHGPYGEPINVCFVDDKNKQALFVFRGISENEWLKTADSLVYDESQSQNEANEFYRETLEIYNLKEKGYCVTLTGFSNGGNKSQFVTVANPNTVDKCVTFNAPGFSNSFTEKYSVLINMVKDKIISYASDKDVISAVGNNISGKQIYLEGKAHRPLSQFPIAQQLFNHPMFAFISVNNEKVQFNSVTNRKDYSDKIHDATNKILELPKKISYDMLTTSWSLLLKADDIDKNTISDLDKMSIGKQISKIMKNKIFVEKAGIPFNKYKVFMGVSKLESLMVLRSRQDYKNIIDEMKQNRKQYKDSNLAEKMNNDKKLTNDNR